MALYPAETNKGSSNDLEVERANQVIMVSIAQSLDILETDGTWAKWPDMAKFVAVFNGVGEVVLPGVSYPGEGGNQIGILEVG